RRDLRLVFSDRFGRRSAHHCADRGGAFRVLSTGSGGASRIRHARRRGTGGDCMNTFVVPPSGGRVRRFVGSEIASGSTEESSPPPPRPPLAKGGRRLFVLLAIIAVGCSGDSQPNKPSASTGGKAGVQSAGGAQEKLKSKGNGQLRIAAA